MPEDRNVKKTPNVPMHVHYYLFLDYSKKSWVAVLVEDGVKLAHMLFYNSN